MSLFLGLNFRRERADATATMAYNATSASGSSSRHASTPDVGRPSQSASNEVSNVLARSESSTMRPTSRFSVADPSAQFMLETRTARPSTTAPLLWRRSIEPRGSSSRTSRGRRSSIARRLIRSRTSSFVPESASTEVGLEDVPENPGQVRVVHDHGPAAVALMVWRESSGPEVLGADPGGAPVDEGVLRMEVAISLHDIGAAHEPADIDAGRQQTAHDPVFVLFDAADR